MLSVDISRSCIALPYAHGSGYACRVLRFDNLLVSCHANVHHTAHLLPIMQPICKQQSTAMQSLVHATAVLSWETCCTGVLKRHTAPSKAIYQG